MYIERQLEKEISKASNNYPVIMVCGQRQVGKSTMLYHIKEEKRRYVTFDDITTRRLAEKDVELFFETYGYCLLIDEFQRVPSILMEIKKIVDEKALKGEDNSGMFWLTGSQKFQMMKGVSESLAGRIAIFNMSSLSNAEIEGRKNAIFNPSIVSLKERITENKKKDIHKVYQNIFKGGMPKLFSSNIERDRYYMDYINTYLDRDIRDLSQVGKINEFNDFLVLIASRTGQEIKYDEISKAVGVSAPTVKTWISILESSGIIVLLKPFASNLSKRLIKTPKLYFMDTGLCSYLCRWPNAETLENGAMDGAFLETYVVSEIIKSYYNNGKSLNLYYYRDIDKKEIDLIIEDGNSIYPIEIKKSKNPSNADKNFDILKTFKKEIKTGMVICMTNELVPYNKDVWLCPISLI